MDKFVSLVISGAASGGIYAIMASGLVLTYQASGIFNFAHAGVAFVVALLYHELHVGLDVPIVPAVLLSVFVFAPLLGFVLDVVLLRRLGTAPMYARIVGTIGLLVALPAIALWLVETLANDVLDLDLPDVTERSAIGGQVPGIGPSPREFWRFDFLGLERVGVNTDQVAVFAAAAFSALVLWLILRRTRIGLEMRAVVDRRELASLRGVSPARSSAVAWMLSTMLAGLGGVCIAPLFQLSDTAFTLVVLGSLAAAATAGLRSIPVAFAAGLGLGVFQNLLYGYSDRFLPSTLTELSGLRPSIPFLLTVVLLCLVVRGRGRLAGSVADESVPAEIGRDLPALRRALPWTLFVGLLLAYTFQVFGAPWARADGYEAAGIVAPGLAYAIIFLSFVVLTGMGGMVSLAQATFVTAGGLTAGWALNRDWGVDIPFVASSGELNFFVAAALGTLVAAAVGALIALTVRGLGVLALALGSLALALSADLIVFQLNDVSNGQLGWSYRFPTWNAFGVHTFDFGDAKTQVVLFLVIFGGIAVLVRNLQHSPSGRAMLAIRSSEIAARTIGIEPRRPQVALFALSAGIAGFGGVMLGMANGALSSPTAGPLSGLLWLAVVVTFGVRRPGGALIAGLAVSATSPILTAVSRWSFMPEAFGQLTGSTFFPAILFGLGAINLAKDPDGLLALVARQRHDRASRRRRGRDPGAVRTATFRTPTPAAPAAGAATETVLAVEDVVAGYGDVEVLHGVSLAVERASVTVVLGANGAGKSTLCGVVAGLVPASGGRVSVGGRDVTRQAPEGRATQGLFLAPEARGIFPGLTVEDNLRVTLRDDDALGRVFEHFPILEERRRHDAGLLSGGEQQMLSLAPALARPPRVIVADEPTLGLAPLAIATILDALCELRDRGVGVLLVEEKAREAMAVADQVIVMERGRVGWTGAREDTSLEELADAYLRASTSPVVARSLGS